MNLFSTQATENILPFDGEVYNYGLVLNKEECDLYFNTFLRLLETVPLKEQVQMIDKNFCWKEPGHPTVTEDGQITASITAYFQVHLVFVVVHQSFI